MAVDFDEPPFVAAWSYERKFYPVEFVFDPEPSSNIERGRVVEQVPLAIEAVLARSGDRWWAHELEECAIHLHRVTTLPPQRYVFTLVLDGLNAFPSDFLGELCAELDGQGLSGRLQLFEQVEIPAMALNEADGGGCARLTVVAQAANLSQVRRDGWPADWIDPVVASAHSWAWREGSDHYLSQDGLVVKLTTDGPGAFQVLRAAYSQMTRSSYLRLRAVGPSGWGVWDWHLSNLKQLVLTAVVPRSSAVALASEARDICIPLSPIAAWIGAVEDVLGSGASSAYDQARGRAFFRSRGVIPDHSLVPPDVGPWIIVDDAARARLNPQPQTYEQRRLPPAHWVLTSKNPADWFPEMGAVPSDDEEHTSEIIRSSRADLGLPLRKAD